MRSIRSVTTGTIPAKDRGARTRVRCWNDFRPRHGEPTAANTPASAGKVVVVAIDGVRYDTLLSVATAAVDRIAAAGFLKRLRVNDAGITVSGPSLATIVTGVLTPRHRIVNNTFAGHALAEWPDFVTRVRGADAGAPPSPWRPGRR